MRPRSLKRILLVDDSPSQLCLCTALLDSLGYELITASNGEQALECATRYAPDLVILDMKLPPWGGVEVVRRLKAEPHTQEAVILAVSGYDFGQIRAAALKAGVEDFLQKPIGAEALRSKVAQLLRPASRTAAEY